MRAARSRSGAASSAPWPLPGIAATPSAAFRRGRRVEPARARPEPAGLAVFRYRTRCGNVYGHTGNFPGYVQFAAATRDGSRALTTSLNIPAPSGNLLARLRAMQQAAVCLLLRSK
jgi:D-alanyl-D-alanine carboxypeptidase